MLKKLRAKLKKDSANAVLVTVIMSMPLLMIVTGFAADMSKSAYVSSSYSSMAQRSAETAVKAIDARGSLDNNSVRKFIDEFKVQNDPSKYHTNETLNASKSGTCSTRKINGVERELPYYEITLGTARGQGQVGSTLVWQISADEAVKDKYLRPDVKYKVINATVYTGSPNFILGMFGTPCQYLKSPVSAISFGDQADLG